MTLARLDIQLPKGTWVGDVTRAHPGATVRVLAAIPDEDAGFGLVSILDGGIDEVLASMAGHEAVRDMEVVGRTDGEVTVQVDTTRPLVLQAAKRSGLPIEPPFHIRDGVATVEVVGGHGRLSEFGRQLDAAGVDFDVEFVGSHGHANRLLTDTQRELVLAGIDRGYYDTPRACSLTELADHVGIAKSTCSETLQRAEARLVRRFVETLPRDRRVSEGVTAHERDGETDGNEEPEVSVRPW